MFHTLFCLAVVIWLGKTNCHELKRNKCCSSSEILTVFPNFTVGCFPVPEIYRPELVHYYFGKENVLSVEECDIVVEPIIHFYQELNYHCVDNLLLENGNSSNVISHPVVGVTCRNSTKQKQSIRGINKCCQLNEMFDFESKKCVSGDRSFSNSITDFIDENNVFAHITIPRCYNVKELTEKNVSYFLNGSYFNINARHHCVEQSTSSKDTIVVKQCASLECATCLPTCTDESHFLRGYDGSLVTETSLFWNSSEHLEQDRILKKAKILNRKNSYWGLHVRRRTLCNTGLQRYTGFWDKIENTSTHNFVYNIYFPYYQHYFSDVCVDFIYNVHYEPEFNLFMCMDPIKYGATIKKTMLIFSSLFIIATLLIHFYLPSLRSLFGKCLAMYLIKSFGINLCWSAIIFNISPIDSFFSFGHLRHYFATSLSCWITLLCFDVWRKMKNFRVLDRLSKIKDERNRLIVYTVLCEGISILFTSWIIYEDVSNYKEFKKLKDGPIHSPTTNIISYNNERLIKYFMIPLSLLFLISMAFFGLTTRNMYRIRRKIECLEQVSEISQTKSYRKRENQFYLVLRLFCGMGLLWAFKLPTYIISFTHLENDYPTLSSVLYLMGDTLMFMQGVFTFVIFIMKPTIYQQIMKRFHAWRSKRIFTYNEEGSYT